MVSLCGAMFGTTHITEIALTREEEVPQEDTSSGRTRGDRSSEY